MSALVHTLSGYAQFALKYASLATLVLAVAVTVLYLLGVAFPKDSDKVQISPFKISSSGGLSVSEASLAKLTKERLVFAQERVLWASKNAKRMLGYSGEVSKQTFDSNRDTVSQLFPDIDLDALSSITTASESDIKSVSFAFQGVDWGGLINWVVKQFQPTTKSVQFHLVHDCNGNSCKINIWGDVENFGLEGKKVLWLTNDNGEVFESIDLLAYRIIQVIASKDDDSEVLRTSPEEFRKSVLRVIETSALLSRGHGWKDPLYMLPKPDDAQTA